MKPKKFVLSTVLAASCAVAPLVVAPATAQQSTTQGFSTQTSPGVWSGDVSGSNDVKNSPAGQMVMIFAGIVGVMVALLPLVTPLIPKIQEILQHR